jgi:drug/metabolite transporter (DMT)-like permease
VVPALAPVGPGSLTAVGTEANRSHPRTIAMRFRGVSSDVILLTAVALWGLNYSVVKFAIGQFEPLALPIFRFGAAGLGLLVILRLREGSIGVRRADLARLAAAGFFGVTLTQVTFVYGLVLATATDIALLGATAPIVTAVIATLVALERSGRRHWIAAGFGFVGVLLIIVGSPVALRLGSGLLGDSLAFASVLTSSFSAILIVPLLTRYSVYRVLTYEVLLGTGMLLPIALPALLAQDFAQVTLEGWVALGYMILATGIVTNLLYVTAMGRIGASRAAIYRYLQSFFGVLFAVLLLAEGISVVQLLGGAIVVASVIFSRSSRGWNRPPVSHHG